MNPPADSPRPRPAQSLAAMMGRPPAARRDPARRPWSGWALGGSGLVVIALLGLGGVRLHQARLDAARLEHVHELPLRSVARVEFRSELTTSGRVESRKNTIISCELERMSVSNDGRTISASGNAIVLDVVAEGSRVAKGDVLCRLNSADYEELVRTQLMKTDQAQAALQQARLSFAVAEMAVDEYRKGLVEQNTLLMEGQIALAQSDLERAGDRLRWTEEMLGKGYVPLSQVTTARRSLAVSRHKLMTSKWDLNNFRKFGDPLALKELQSEVEKRRYEVVANEQRVGRLEERLATYRKMVDFCTIRSPHDGFVIYATDPFRRDAPRLEPGVEVRQQQQLFFLPDLTDMEVTAYVHESVARQVGEGMAAQVRLEGMGNRVLMGHVASIGPLPVSSPTWTISQEVKYFIARIKLAEAPPGILPGMSAEVVVKLDRSRDVLAIPTEAVASEQGQNICYVARVDGLERRSVTLGRSNIDLLEVTHGLAEGEAVVANPNRVESLESLVNQFEGSSRSTAAEPGETGGFAGSAGPVGVE